MLYLWILRVVFLVGTTEEPELQERIDRESSTYMDIVQVSASWQLIFCPNTLK